MCPTIATRDGAALFAVGASGANHIVPCTAQLAALMLDYGLSLEEAFHTPRIDASARGSLRADPAMGEAALAELRKVFTLEVAQQLVFPKLYARSEEHTSELQSLMRISYAVFCLKKKNNKQTQHQT